MTLNSSEDKLVVNTFPVGMQNSELVLHNEEGSSSVVTDFDEFSSASDQNFTPAAINVENSQDVIIGPVTQFHGPVTIYQNVNGALRDNLKDEKCFPNGKLVKSESSSSDTVLERPKKLLPKRLKYVGIPVLLVIIVSIAASAMVLSSKKEQVPTEPPPTTSSDADSSGSRTAEPIGPGSVIDRAKWHGHQPNFTRPLPHPTPLVIISHTVTPFCRNFAECSAQMLSMQESHINKLGSPDIGYNFVIGGDACVYVGRGWDSRNFHGLDSIGISFIGNYLVDSLTDDMIKYTKRLIEDGVRSGKLAKEYKVIAHNQTFNTESPGKNVFKIIKTWPHYDPRLYYI